MTNISLKYQERFLSFLFPVCLSMCTRKAKETHYFHCNLYKLIIKIWDNRSSDKHLSLWRWDENNWEDISNIFTKWWKPHTIFLEIREMIDKAARTTMDIFLVNVLSEEVMKKMVVMVYFVLTQSLNLHFNIIFQMS